MSRAEAERPGSNGYRHAFVELVKISKQQTEQMTRQTAQLMQQTKLLEQIAAGQLSERGESDRRTDIAVEELKHYVKEAIVVGYQAAGDEDRKWWRRVIWWAIGLVSISNLVGASLSRVIGLIKSGG